MWILYVESWSQSDGPYVNKAGTLPFIVVESNIGWKCDIMVDQPMLSEKYHLLDPHHSYGSLMATICFCNIIRWVYLCFLGLRAL